MEKATQSKKCRKVGPYILLRPIGKGSYSTVYEALCESKIYAVKQISLQNLKEKSLERIHQELDVLKVIKHKNIIQLVDFKQTSHNLYLVFEHCKKTDLNEFIQKHYGGKLPQDQVRRILTQLKGAFQQIRKHQIVHRDLKLQNILVTEDFEVKLADFGFAKFLEQNEFLTSWVGSPLTMAPEVFWKKKYNQKCDMWSLGIITYQMLFGCHPFFLKDKLSRNEISQDLKKPIVFPFEVDPHFKELITKMLVVDHQKRLDFDDFFRDPWLEEDSICLAELLRGEVLKSQLTRSLISSSKTSLQKEFILENCQTILIYFLIEFLRNYIENSLTNWINVAKHILELKHPNMRLTFLALALIMENIERTIEENRTVLLNATTSLPIPKFMQLRELQTWEMSQYTKRLPGFLSKSRITINEYLQGQGKVYFSKEQGALPLSTLFLKEISAELDNKKRSQQNDLRLFLKVKSWQGTNISINITSNVLSKHALSILIRKISLKLNYHQLCKKCSSLFRLAVVNEPTQLQLKLQNLRNKILSQSYDQ